MIDTNVSRVCTIGTHWHPCSEKGLVVRGNEFDFNPVRIFEIHGIGAAGVRMTVLIQNCNAPGSEFARQLIYMRFRLSVKGEMVQPDSASMIGYVAESILNLHEYDIRTAEFPALPALPVLIWLIPEPFEKPAPELDRSREIANINLDVVQHASFNWLFSSPESC